MKCPNCNKEISDEVITKEAATINGKKTKGRKRKDLEVGGKTWDKIQRTKKGGKR